MQHIYTKIFESFLTTFEAAGAVSKIGLSLRPSQKQVKVIQINETLRTREFSSYFVDDDYNPQTNCIG